MTTIQVDRLGWDSDFFGYEVGKVHLNKITPGTLRQLKEASVQFKLVYVFSDEYISDDDLVLVDEKVTLSRAVSKNLMASPCKDFAIESFVNGKHDKEQVFSLALKSGVYSRFKVDTNFENNEYEKLYTRWIHNSIHGESMIDVLIATNEQEITGFITLQFGRKPSAEIGLVAVHENHRGKGIGKALLEAALWRCSKERLDRLDVVTQKANIPAMSLYETCGFEVIDLRKIYHLWNK